MCGELLIDEEAQKLAIAGNHLHPRAEGAGGGQSGGSLGEGAGPEGAQWCPRHGATAPARDAGSASWAQSRAEEPGAEVFNSWTSVLSRQRNCYCHPAEAIFVRRALT